MRCWKLSARWRKRQCTSTCTRWCALLLLNTVRAAHPRPIFRWTCRTTWYIVLMYTPGRVVLVGGVLTKCLSHCRPGSRSPRGISPSPPPGARASSLPPRRLALRDESRMNRSGGAVVGAALRIARWNRCPGVRLCPARCGGVCQRGAVYIQYVPPPGPSSPAMSPRRSRRQPRYCPQANEICRRIFAFNCGVMSTGHSRRPAHARRVRVRFIVNMTRCSSAEMSGNASACKSNSYDLKEI